MNEEIINKVQRLRTKVGITQGELGSALGVTRQTIIAIEKGNYTPSVMLAIKIAKYFKKSVEDVFNIVK